MEATERETLEALLKWAALLGISDSPDQIQSQKPNSCLGYSLTVSYFADSGGRGLAAVRDLRKGELILKVPKCALLTRDGDSLLKDEILSLAVNGHSYLSHTQILTVCLLYEMSRGKKSRWYPYLIVLPRSYDTLVSFSEFEAQALQVEDAVWMAEKVVSKAELEWKEANSLMEELKLKPQLVTFRAWIWASATISSRTLHIPWDEAGCLCPIGDLFNYAAPGEESNGFENVESRIHTSSLLDGCLSNWKATEILAVEPLDADMQRLTDGGFDEDIAAYCFYARKNYKTGEQVLLSYGTYTNLELLEHYGFLLSENPNDKAFIPLEPSVYLSNPWPKESVYIHGDGKPSFALLSALRLWSTPRSLRKSVGHLAYSGTQLSAENEVSVMKWIAKNCQVILNNLSTEIEEDVVLLSGIDKIQNYHEQMDVGKVLCTLDGDEVCGFLEANGMQKGKNGAEMQLSGKTRRSIGRWKLAVEWRFRYKKILIDCISYCNEIINLLSGHA